MRRTTLAVPILLFACGTDTADGGPVTGKLPEDRVWGVPAADPVEPVQAFSLGVAALGMARGPGGALWLLAPGEGLVETTAAGEERSRIRWGEQGLVDQGFTDLAVLDDGSFALIRGQEVLRYRPRAEAMESWFCLVPESGTIVQENQAIAYRPATGLVTVAPATWDTSTGSSEPFSIRLEIYTAADAAWQSALDITASGVIARGLAWDSRAGFLWLAEASRLHRFTTEGILDGSFALEGVSDAQAIVVDEEQLAILDGATGAVSVHARPE